MNEYILTILDEPDNPIILSQQEFEIIYEAGLIDVQEKTLNEEGKPLKETILQNKSEATVTLGTIQPKDENIGYFYNNLHISEAEVAVNFQQGIRHILQSFLNNHKTTSVED